MTEVFKEILKAGARRGEEFAKKAKGLRSGSQEELPKATDEELAQAELYEQKKETGRKNDLKDGLGETHKGDGAQGVLEGARGTATAMLGENQEEPRQKSLTEAEAKGDEDPSLVENAELAGEHITEEVPKKEEKGEGTKSLEMLKKDLEEKRAKYARLDTDISGKWSRLKRVLGLNIKEVKNKDVDVEKARREYYEALEKYAGARKASLPEGDKKAAAELLKEVRLDEALNIFNAKTDERLKARKERGDWPSKLMDGYMKAVEKWRGYNWKTKLALSGILLTAGAASGLYGIAFGSIGAGVFSTFKISQRALSAGATGLGIKKMWDAASLKRMEKKSVKEIEGMLSKDDWLDRFDSKLDESIKSVNERLAKIEKKDLTRKRVAVWAGILFGGGGMIFDIYKGWSGSGLGKTADVVSGKPSGAGVTDVRKPSGIGQPPVEKTPGTHIGTHIEPPKAPPADEVIKSPAVTTEDIISKPPDKYVTTPIPAETTEKMTEFMGDSTEIKKGGSIWKSVRRLYMKHPEEYGYGSDGERVKSLFKSFKEQGILKRLGIRGIDNFEDLTDEQKIKIWSEWKTANSVRDLSISSGGRIKDLVHAGDKIFLDKDGKITFDFERGSGIRPGYLSGHETGAGKGGGVAEVVGGGAGAEEFREGEKPAWLEEYDKRIGETRLREQAAEARLDRADEYLRKTSDDLAAAREAETAAIDYTRTHELMDYIQQKLSGVDIDWGARGSAMRMYDELKQGSLINSDQPMAPDMGKEQYWKTLRRLTDDLGKPRGGETVEEWVKRGLERKKISPERVISVLKKVSNG